MEKIFIGKIVNTFGIKGMLKINSSFEMRKKAFVKNNEIIINDHNYLITESKLHKNNYLIEINNLKDINLVLNFINQDVYINRKELKLQDNEYLYNDLLNLEVYDNNHLTGLVTEVIPGKNPLIKINNKFYIPIKSDFIIKMDFKNKKLICQNLKGLML
ncbi:MAG: ribosome maturation factor RimM [Bacilli bacterium]|nr:ribosome maturation factor RimM [Bacilli bacterium]MDD3896186.1 ribosome maturation factor RimM [Bacilli bacterium]